MKKFCVMSSKLVKTRSESESEEDACWDSSRVLGCLISATTGLQLGDVNTVNDVIKAFKSAVASFKCLTKASALSVAKAVVGRFPIIAAGTFISGFTLCMGWL